MKKALLLFVMACSLGITPLVGLETGEGLGEEHSFLEDLDDLPEEMKEKTEKKTYHIPQEMFFKMFEYLTDENIYDTFIFPFKDDGESLKNKVKLVRQFFNVIRYKEKLPQVTFTDDDLVTQKVMERKVNICELYQSCKVEIDAYQNSKNKNISFIFDKLSPNLEELSCIFGNQVNDVCFENLLKCKQLKKVDVKICAGLTDNGVKYFPDTLTHLSMGEVLFFKGNNLQRLTKLQVFRLTSMRGGFIEGNLSKLSPTLLELDIPMFQLTVKGTVHFLRFNNLKKLSCQLIHLREDSLEMIPRGVTHLRLFNIGLLRLKPLYLLKNLETLEVDFYSYGPLSGQMTFMRGTDYLQEVLDSLKKIENLKSMKLKSRLGFNKKEFDIIAQFPKLERLIFKEAFVAKFRILEKLKTLKYLEFSKVFAGADLQEERAKDAEYLKFKGIKVEIVGKK